MTDLPIESVRIRPILQDEIDILEDLLYETVFQQPDATPLPKEIIKKPEIYAYIDNFGQPGDHCLVAEMGGKIVGAVWTRILAGEIKGFGNVDAQTPEFAIAVFSQFRNRGIGKALMCEMIRLLTVKGYRQASLSVQKKNHAVKLYQTIGFEIIQKREEEYLMTLKLDNIQSPKQVLTRWIELFNQADATAIAELYHEDAVNHQVANEPVEGKANIRNMFERDFAVDEMVCIPENLFEDGEWAILEWRAPLGLRGCGFFHVVDGKIKFQRGYWDKLSFLRQHGLPFPTE